MSTISTVKRRLHYHDLSTPANPKNIGHGGASAAGLHLTNIALGAGEDERSGRAIRIRDLLCRLHIGYFDDPAVASILMNGCIRTMIVADLQPEGVYENAGTPGAGLLDMTAVDGSGTRLLQKILVDENIRAFQNPNYLHTFNILYDDVVLFGPNDAGATQGINYTSGDPFVEVAIPIEHEMRYDGTSATLEDHGNYALYAIFCGSYPGGGAAGTAPHVVDPPPSRPH